MTPLPQAKPTTAVIIGPGTGRLIGGLLHAEHGNGEVTILFGGLKRRGKALSLQDIQAIEQSQEAANEVV